MITTKRILTDRLIQSENRKFLIQKYIDDPSMGLGGRQYSKVDIDKMQIEIDHCKVALQAIEKLKELIKLKQDNILP